jgi:DNA-binding transcriptional MerR regulator
MAEYSVKQLSEVARVSIRTLHYYDEIGLLRPATRSHAGYRLYGEKELLRLQQILFYRELDMGLDAIREILDAPDFKEENALRNHRDHIRKEIKRLVKLQATIDKTLQRIKGENTMLTDEELYSGFAPGEGEEYAQEARERYGVDVVDASYSKIRKLTKEQWHAVKGEGETIARELAEKMDHVSIDSQEVQALIKRHHAWIENFYTAPKELYQGLGAMYTDDPRFKAFYDKYKSGLAEYLRNAMEYFCVHSL